MISLSALAVQKEPDTYFDEAPGSIYAKEFQPFKASENTNFGEPHKIYRIAKGRRIEYAINLEAVRKGKPLSFDTKFNREKLAEIRQICPKHPEMKYNCWIAETDIRVLLAIADHVSRGGRQLTPEDFPYRDKQYLVEKRR